MSTSVVSRAGSASGAAASTAALHQVDEFEGEVVHACAELANLVHEVVVGDHSRDGSEQSGSGRDERLGNSRCYRSQRSRAGGAETVEGIDDAPYRAEQADE